MNLFHVPLFVRAATPEELVREMIKIQVRDSITYKFFEIYKDGEQHVAWYFGDASQLVKSKLTVTPTDPANGIKKNKRG